MMIINTESSIFSQCSAELGSVDFAAVAANHVLAYLHIQKNAFQEALQFQEVAVDAYQTRMMQDADTNWGLPILKVLVTGTSFK